VKEALGLVFLLFLLAGCSQQQENPATGNLTPQNACINLCTGLKNSRDFSPGPCIGNPLQDFPDWVCDIAHSPRQEVDNQPENQCSAFAQGNAKHFVELTPECKFIKQY